MLGDTFFNLRIELSVMVICIFPVTLEDYDLILIWGNGSGYLLIKEQPFSS